MKFHSNMFGREYVWEDFADEKGGKAIHDAENKEGASHVLGVEIPHAELKTVISVMHTNKNTVLTAGFLPVDDFSLHLFVEHLIHRVEKVFGMTDIKVGDQRFDSRYVIHSNSQEKLIQIFAEASLRDAILESGLSEIKIVPPGGATQSHAVVTPGHSVLTCSLDGIVEKYDQLNAVYEAFVQLLTHVTQSAVVHQATAVVVPSDLQPVHEPAPMRLHSPLLDM